MDPHTIDNMISLLKRLTIIREKHEARLKLEDQFNIFSILHKSHDEKRLHSRFISALLYPSGSHKRGTKFLSYFMDIIEGKIDLNGVEIYPNEHDKSEANNIDILIINRKSKEAIIIENKIYAGDSNNEGGGQLQRYFDRIVKVEKIPKNRISVYYLSLDGHEPTQESLGGENSSVRKHYCCISYKNHIAGWINKCLEQSATSPFLRESLSQYLVLLNHMTNEISIDEILEIRDLISKSDDNMQSAKLLVENFNHVKWHTVRDFWNELKDEIEKLGYQVTELPNDKNITDTSHYEEYKKGNKKNNDYGIRFHPFPELELYIWHQYDRCLFWGCYKDGKTSHAMKKRLTDFRSKTTCFETSSNDIIWKYFNLPDDQRIYLSNFTHNGTFNLINRVYRNRIVKSLLEEIKVFCDSIKKNTTSLPAHQS